MTADGNIFAALPAASLAEELVTALVSQPNIRIERIVSTGQTSPPDFWFDQEWNEWVILLSGSAQLLFEDEPSEGENDARPLAAGDYVYIPAHRRHRIIWTDPQQTTVWLAIHFR